LATCSHKWGRYYKTNSHDPGKEDTLLLHFRQNKWDLLFILILGWLVNYLSRRFSGLLPEMPLNVPTFLGTAISVLLSFKMSQSYDRWWEARKVWGAIVNDSRTFVLQLQNFVAASDHPVVRRMVYRQIGWCYSLGQSLRGFDPLQHLGKYISEEELSQLATHSNKPLAILQLNSQDLKQLRADGQLDPYSHVQLDNTLVRFCDSMGKAERISNTVFPVTYRLFLHAAIYLFVVILSLSLKNVPPAFEMPLLLLISALFLLLQKTAFHLQDPFKNRPSDIPVTAIARTIEINLRQLIGEKETLKPLQPNGFYLL
jgi:putative membrane protein